MTLLTPGTMLQERYRVDHLIGHGGFGAVYEAVDLRLNRRIALKQLLRAGDRLSRQFEREAQLLANLDHPSLPDVHDHFSTPDGQFLVMQYVPGDDLGTLLLEQDVSFPVDRVLGWASELLDALQYLHTRRPPIVHRDIKPQNLKLQHDGKIMLLDFGLAKGFAGENPPSTVERSLLAYTKGYAPPEQVEGLGTDERSDLYALGATLYSLLTNAAPIEAQTRLLAAARGRPDPLRPAHEINTAVPEAVSRVLEQALQLERDDRPQSAQAMRGMLEAARGGVQPARPVAAQSTAFRLPPTAPATTPARALESQSTMVDTVSMPYQATPRPAFVVPEPQARAGVPPRPSRSLVPLMLGGAGLLLVLLVATFVVMSRSRAADPGVVAVSSTPAQASAEPQPSDTQAQPSDTQARPSAIEPASSALPSPPQPTAAPAAASLAAALPSAAGQASAGAADGIAQFVASAQQALRRPGGVDEAIIQLESGVRANDGSAELHALLALAYMQRFRWGDVAREAQRAIELNPGSALAYSARSRAQRGQGELDLALADADKAIELDPGLSLGYTARSYAHTAMAEKSGDADKLDDALSAADAAVKSASDEDSYSQDEALGARASAFHTRYLLDGLAKDYEQAIDDYRRAVGGELQLGWQSAQLGRILSDAGRYDEARAALDQAIKRDPALGSAHEALGWLLFQQGQYDGAIDSFTQAIQLGADDATSEVFYGRAIAHHANAAIDGKDREAELTAAYGDMGKAIELDQEEGWYWYELGAITKKLFAQTDPSNSSAFTSLRTALGYFQADLERNPDDADAHEGLGRTHYELEEYDAAVSEFDAAIALKPQHPAAYLGKGYALNAKGDSAGACQALTDGIGKRRHRTDTTLEAARTTLGCQ